MTTIWYPDLSHWDYDRGLVALQAATVAVCAKATHGMAFIDERYEHWETEAARVGALFSAYHWLNHGNAAAQAAYCHTAVGDTPLMLDAEDTPGNTGWNGPLTMEDVVDFVRAFRFYGGRVWGVYLPRWYWMTRMGSPDLTMLADHLGVALVASSYSTYADDGPGWNAYGGVTPTAWQYTDKLPYAGSSCDFNAFRGSVAELRALWEGLPMALTDIVHVTDNSGQPRKEVAEEAILSDLSTLRDILISAPETLTAQGIQPPAGSVLDLLIRRATATPALPFTAVDVAAALITQLGAQAQKPIS